MDFVKSIGSSVVQKIDSLQGSELEKKVKDATSNENWGASTMLKNEIVDATYDYQGLRDVMGMLWKRIGEKQSNWRIIFKSLELLMLLLKCGHDRVIDEARDHQYTLKKLTNFTLIDPINTQDKGRGIRQLSQQILELIGDNKRLCEVRAEAQRQRKKLLDAGLASDRRNNGGAEFNSNSTVSAYKFHASVDDNNNSNDENDEKASPHKKPKKKQDYQNGEFDCTEEWTDDEGSKRKRRKKKEKEEGDSDDNDNDNDKGAHKHGKHKKKQKKQTDDDENETETTQSDEQESDEEGQNTKKKKKQTLQKEKISPAKSMKLEPLPPPTGEKKSESNNNFDIFGFDPVINALQTLNIAADLNGPSSFDVPKVNTANFKNTSTLQRNNGNSAYPNTFNNNQTRKNMQPRDLFSPNWNNNIPDKGGDEFFGEFQSNDGTTGKTSTQIKTIGKTQNGSAGQEKTIGKGSENGQPNANLYSNNIWGLSGNPMGNVPEKNGTYTTFTPNATPLLAYGNNRSQPINGINSMGMAGSVNGSFNNMNMGFEMGNMPINPGTNMGRGINPAIYFDMGTNPPMGGMNPNTGGMYPTMATGTGVNLNYGHGNSRQQSNIW